MKSDTKVKIILVILGITFALTTVMDNDPTSIAGNIDISDEGLRLSTVSAKIHIDNNWTEVKIAGICTGEGTSSDPYIIEDLIIDAGGADYGILIENSNDSFRIENVTIYSALNGSGIKLYHTNNGNLINNNCSSNREGITLWVSHSNTISKNIVYNNNINGMDIWWSNNNNISENFIYNNTQAGISSGGDWNNILGNIVNNNYIGIVLSSSGNNTISGNNAYNNTDSGILIYNSNNNIISGNTANYNKYGIRLDKSDYNVILGNIFSNNHRDGIFLDTQSWYNEILENNLNSNRCGFDSYGSYYNTIYFNNFKENTQNVSYLVSSHNWNSEKKIVYTYKNRNFTNYLGNYWDDYTGIDANNDGIGDTPYLIGNPYVIEERDNYPLMEPIENYVIIKIAERSERRIPGYDLFLLLSITSVVVILINKKLRNS